MLRRRRWLVVGVLSVAMVAVGSQAFANPQAGRKGVEGPSTTGTSSDGGITAGAGTVPVTIDAGGTTNAGTPFRTSVTVPVPRRCWYGAGPTGLAYYEQWKDGGPGRASMTGDAYAAQGLLHDGFEQYATDTEGRWYEAECAAHVPGEERVAYLESRPAVYVRPGDRVPPVEESVDPQVLAQLAVEHMQLPTGTVRWNPSLQGSGATVVLLDTFVWVEDAPTVVEVTASVPGVWSRVEARLAGMTLSSDLADEVTCADLGAAYVPGMRRSDCAVVFERSTAGLPVKEGQSLPTTTLTATTTWAATWTSSLDPTPRDLPSQTRSVQAEVPVAEIQTIVTR